MTLDDMIAKQAGKPNMDEYLKVVRCYLALDELDDVSKQMAMELREKGLNARSAAYRIKETLIGPFDRA